MNADADHVNKQAANYIMTTSKGQRERVASASRQPQDLQDIKSRCFSRSRSNQRRTLTSQWINPAKHYHVKIQRVADRQELILTVGEISDYRQTFRTTSRDDHLGQYTHKYQCISRQCYDMCLVQQKRGNFGQVVRSRDLTLYRAADQ